MEIATIVPTSHLCFTEQDGYKMALAHVAKEDRRYFEFFKETEGFTILDNGAAELGEGVGFDSFYEMAMKLEPDEIVVPDVLLDAEATIQRAQDFYESGMYLGPWDRRMGVPQGKTLEEYRESLAYFLEQEWVTTIGISRFVSKIDINYSHRWTLLARIPELLESDKEIHMLGCSTDPLEFCTIDRRLPGRIRGADSGIAAIFTQAGMRLANGDLKPNIELDFSNRYDVPNSDLLMENVVAWKRRIREGIW